MPDDVASARIVLATWNIHGGIGCDRRYAPTRIADVVNELDADVVALQEVGSHEVDGDLLRAIADATGYTALAAPTHRRRCGDFGNAVLTRLPIVSSAQVDLSVPGCEPRNALDIVVQGRGGALRVLGTHLGLRPRERREQVQRLLRALEAEVPLTTALTGDINEWWLWGRPLRWLHRHFERAPAPLTFPSRRPVFALDRVWVEPARRLRSVNVHCTPLARIASDHLPVLATIDVGESEPSDTRSGSRVAEREAIVANEG
jgi:endonuclease/exonuclease/phosphatase family metal-dependent hydrolase